MGDKKPEAKEQKNGALAPAPVSTIVAVPINDLRPNEYNPKKATEHEINMITDSIRKFGFVIPILANCTKKRNNVIIGGRHRWGIAKTLGFTHIDVIYRNIPELAAEQELCLRLSKNIIGFDPDELANFDQEDLARIGFGEEELAEIRGEGAEGTESDGTRRMVEFPASDLEFVMEALDDIEIDEAPKRKAALLGAKIVQVLRERSKGESDT